MIFPTTLFIGSLRCLFCASKKEFLLDHHDPTENKKENDDLYKDLEDLYYLKKWHKYLRTLFLD